MSDGTPFDDAEPEDAWDAEDPIPIQIDNLFMRVSLLNNEPLLQGRVTLLDAIEFRLQAFLIKVPEGEAWVSMRDRLEERAKVRLDQLVEDLAFLRERVDG